MNLENLKVTAVARGQHGRLVLQKYSPEILLGAGIVGVIGATVWACHATLKAQEVIETTKDVKERMDQLKNEMDEETYSEGDYQRDLTIVAVQTTVELVKLYLPAIVIGSVSIAMLLQSRNILNRRNAGLMAAYKLVDEAYKSYRQRVREELGEDVDDYFRFVERDPDKKLTVKMKKKGKKEADFALTEEELDFVDYGYSQYAKFFDESSIQWNNGNNENNIFFLRSQQTNANVQLQTRGHITLNEVYDMLGIPRTTAGFIVGWVKGHGDDIVDFGIFNDHNDYNADFINGYQRDRILLDFNVDGVIYDIV